MVVVVVVVVGVTGDMVRGIVRILALAFQLVCQNSRKNGSDIEGHTQDRKSVV